MDNHAGYLGLPAPHGGTSAISNSLCAEEAEPVVLASGNTPIGLVISDGGRLRLALTEDFGFAKSDPIANRRNIDISLDSLALYLLNNPERHLTITGFYKPGEIIIPQQRIWGLHGRKYQGIPDAERRSAEFNHHYR